MRPLAEHRRIVRRVLELDAKIEEAKNAETIGGRHDDHSVGGEVIEQKLLVKRRDAVA